MRSLARSLGCGLAAAAIMAAGRGNLEAQGRLVGFRSSSVGVLFEHWSFSDQLPQPTLSGDGTVLVDHASQISFPLGVNVPLGENWSVDLTTAFTNGRVTLAAPDPEVGVDRYTLNGLTDTRLRATGRLSPAVSLTFGLNVPTGKTSLNPEEYSAFRVLAAPALGFQIPRLGSGVSGTAGIVLSRQLGDRWAGALGVSYELRGKYEAGTLVAALSSADYSPGDAIRFSAGFDGLVGGHGMTLGLSADVYPTNDVISDAALATRLGPVLTADWQLRLGSAGFRELTLYAVDRYRTRFRSGEPGGLVAVAQSSGNYLDAGVRSVVAAGPATGILAALNFRHQTGLKVDDTFSTAGLVSGALTLGLVRELGRGYVAQPFVRGQLGKIKNGEASSTAVGLAAGVTLGLRF